jgi:hypothetical protein
VLLALRDLRQLDTDEVRDRNDVGLQKSWGTLERTCCCERQCPVTFPASLQLGKINFAVVGFHRPDAADFLSERFRRLRNRIFDSRRIRLGDSSDIKPLHATARSP